MKVAKIYKFICTVLTLSVVTLAVHANTLTVYTYDSFASEWGPGPKLKALFEDQCECQLNFVALDDALAMLGRLKLEGKDSPADVVVGLDLNTLIVAKETGLFGPHDVSISDLTLPIEWNDDVFVPFDYGYFAFVYNSEVVKQPPQSLAELIKNDPEHKLVIQDPRSSTPGLGLLLWIKQIYGNQAPQIWEQLSPSILTVTPGWSEAYGLFLEGEADLVLSYTTSPAYHLIAEQKDNYHAAEFSEGHYIQVETAAMVENSKHPDLARQFLQFLISEQAQNSIPTGNWMYPSALQNDKLPDEFSQLIQPQKTLMISPQDIAQNKKQWINEVVNTLAK